MSEHQVPAGSLMYFGAPANPMPKTRSDAIAAMVAATPGILEAHLPLLMISGQNSARQVLMIRVQDEASKHRIAEALLEEIQKIDLGGEHLDIFPSGPDESLDDILACNCQIFPVNQFTDEVCAAGSRRSSAHGATSAAPSKPWWKFW